MVRAVAHKWHDTLVEKIYSMSRCNHPQLCCWISMEQLEKIGLAQSARVSTIVDSARPWFLGILQLCPRDLQHPHRNITIRSNFAIHAPSRRRTYLSYAAPPPQAGTRHLLLPRAPPNPPREHHASQELPPHRPAGTTCSPAFSHMNPPRMRCFAPSRAPGEKGGDKGVKQEHKAKFGPRELGNAGTLSLRKQKNV